MQRVAYHPDTAKIKLLLWQNSLRDQYPRTVRELARKLDCNSSTISRAIAGKIRDGRWIEAIASEMKIPVSDIAKRIGRRAA